MSYTKLTPISYAAHNTQTGVTFVGYILEIMRRVVKGGGRRRIYGVSRGRL
jgi:hypothetical protein